MLAVDVALKALSKDDIKFLDDLLVAGKGTAVATARGWSRYQLGRQVNKIRRAFGNERLWRVVDAYRLSKIAASNPNPNLSNIEPPQLDEVMQRFMNIRQENALPAKPVAASPQSHAAPWGNGTANDDLMKIASGMAQQAVMLTCLGAVSFSVALGAQVLKTMSNSVHQAATARKDTDALVH